MPTYNNTQKPSEKSIEVAKKLLSLGVISALMSACTASMEVESLTERDRGELAALIEREVE